MLPSLVSAWLKQVTAGAPGNGEPRRYQPQITKYQIQKHLKVNEIWCAQCLDKLPVYLAVIFISLGAKTPRETSTFICTMQK